MYSGLEFGVGAHLGGGAGYAMPEWGPEDTGDTMGCLPTTQAARSTAALGDRML